MKYRNIHNQNYQNLFGMVGNLERFGSVDAMVALPFSTRNVLSLPTATDRWVSNKLKDFANYPVIRKFAYGYGSIPIDTFLVG